MNEKTKEGKNAEDHVHENGLGVIAIIIFPITTMFEFF